METLNDIRDKLLVKKKNRELLLVKKEQLEQSKLLSLQSYELAKKTQALIEEAAQMTLETISLRINTIVTNAISAVLPEPYTFELGFKIFYGKLATEMQLIRDGKVYDPKEDNGDGLVDIVALALRIAVLCLDKRKLRRILIMDEPMSALSVNYHELAGKMLSHLSRTLGVQIIMISSHGSHMQIEGEKVFDSRDFVEGAII